MTEALLIAIALATSTLTAITGVGGGMILIAAMPGFVPAAAIVPVHAVVQLFSNSSRALFGWRFLRADFVIAFAAGAFAGGLAAAGFLRQIDLDYVPLLIACYILYSIWGPDLQFRIPLRVEFVTIGLLQTALSMVVAATGPMSQTALLRRHLARDALVVNSALMTSITHAVKIIMFTLLGFAFFDYWRLILGMSLGVIAGAWLGTHIRYRIPEDRYRRALKWLLTLLALRMIYITLA